MDTVVPIEGDDYGRGIHYDSNAFNDDDVDGKSLKPSWGWDYLFIFPARGDDEVEVTAQRIDVLARLKLAGFVFSQMYVPSEEHVYVRFGLRGDMLKKKAEKIGMELRLKDKFGGGYLAYRTECYECFVNHDEEKERGCYFSASDRILIVLRTLQSKDHWGAGLNVENMVYKKLLVKAFAIHIQDERKFLIRAAVWDRWWDPSWKPPFLRLKYYLGARVGLYFAFVSFYANMLLWLVLLAIPTYVVFRVVKNPVVIASFRLIFGVSLVLWTTGFIEFWKRKTASLMLDWGLNDYHEDTEDHVRPQFTGELRHGFYCRGGFVALDDLREHGLTQFDNEDLAPSRFGKVTMPRNPWCHPNKTRRAILTSLGTTIFFVCLITSATFLLLWYRQDISQAFGGTHYNFVPGVINGLLITISDPIWKFLSTVLTRWENHRSDQDYENSLVYKRFAFQFVSNFSSLYYLSFIKPYLARETCQPSRTNGPPDCMGELESQLLAVIITKAVVQQIIELSMPFVVGLLQRCIARFKGRNGVSEDNNASSAANRYVTEAKLSAYETTIEDYAELVIQFGFLAQFGLAFPLAALINLANNILEVRTDAFKILMLSQRVNANDAADIGAWYNVLQFICGVSILTNVGLIVFTSDALSYMFDNLRLVDKVVGFFVMEHSLIVLNRLIAFLVKDIPTRVQRKLARQDYDIARWFDAGWRNSFRGSPLLEVRADHIAQCKRYENMFDVASEEVSSFTQQDHKL